MTTRRLRGPGDHTPAMPAAPAPGGAFACQPGCCASPRDGRGASLNRALPRALVSSVCIRGQAADLISIIAGACHVPPPPRLPLPKLSAGVRGDRDERASALPPPKAPCRGLREAEAGPDGTPRASASEVDSQGAGHQGGALRGPRAAAAGERGGRARERTPGAMSFQASAASGHRIRPRR